MIDYESATELFEACRSGEVDAHWYLTPLCQSTETVRDQRLGFERERICGTPLGDYPHNEYGDRDHADGTDEGRWHAFVAPTEPLVWGENAYRKNVCPGTRYGGEHYSEIEASCYCPCHWGSYYVNIYLLDRGYGGPEEGGWWYDSGSPVAAIPAESYAEAKEIVTKYETRYPATKSRYSMAPRESDYAIRIEREFAQSWPERRPRYE